jgi:hypothetical protein
MSKPPKTTLRVVDPSPVDPLEPPMDLGEDGRNLWRSIMAEYRIDDAPGRAMLKQICACADLAEKAHERSAIKDELAARAFIVRGLQKLNLDIEAGPGRVGRPPGPKVTRA